MKARFSEMADGAAVLAGLWAITGFITYSAVRSLPVWKSAPLYIGVWVCVGAVFAVVLHFVFGWSWSLILRGREPAKCE